jgi:hypothetical protein
MTVPATGNPVHGPSRPGARPGLRVLPHEPVCPDCGSFDVITDEVDTGDGIEETAYICEDPDCGCAWPLACICDWGTRDVS